MKSIQNQIKHLLKQKNAVLVAHYYVSGDLQDLAQETCSNVPISKSMCQFPVLMITNCQNITINYNIFPRK